MAALLAAVSVRPAAAHGYLVRAIPEDRAALERSPARVQYWFSEALEPDFSALTVRDQAGNVIATGGISENDDKLLSARLPIGLPEGAYLVELRLAFASDGHLIVETRVFFVGEAVAGIGGAVSSDQAVPLETAWRALLLVGTMLLTGVLWAYVLVLVPAWGNPAYPAGLLPPRLMTRLYAIAFASLALAATANLLALMQQTMLLFNVDAGRAIGEGLWHVVRIGTRFGDTWSWRMLLLGVITAALAAAWYFRREQPELVRPFWSAAAWAAPLIIFTWSISAHAAGALVLPWAAVFGDWLHGAAVGVWVGGLAALTLVLPVALGPYTGDTRRQALMAALRRFTHVALAAALVVIATGIYNASNWLTEANDASTPYALTLALKVAMVAGLLAVGAAHHISLRPERYVRWAGIRQRVGDFLPTLRIEAWLGVALLILAAWVSATPVPQPELVPQSPPPGGVQEVGEYTISTTVTPGGPGANTYDVQVTRGGQPEDSLDVRIQLVNPALERRGDAHVAEAAGDGLYVAAGAEIARSGDWWALVDVRDGGELQRAAFVIPVRDEAAVSLTRAPSLINLLALAGLVSASVFALAPTLRRLRRYVDVSPSGLLVGALALVAGIGVIVGAAWLSDDSNRRTEAALYPMPQVVNTVLPDAASLARGAALLERACAWASQPGDLGELAERMGRWRDEELYSFTHDGWRSLPPCMDGLTAAERWDIVNALRVLEVN